MKVDSRFSLYDLLSMFFPGCFILWLIFTWTDVAVYAMRFSYMDSEINKVIACFISAYLIGVMWDMIFGNLWRKATDWFNNKYLREIEKEKSKDDFKYIDSIPGDSLDNKYHYARWYVRQYDMHYTINVVESQISLLRNMALPFALWMGMIAHQCSQNYCCLVLVTIVVFSFVIFMAFRRQKRMIKLILGNYHNLKKIKNDESLKIMRIQIDNN